MIEYLLPILTAAVAYYQSEKFHRNEQTDAALSSLLKALDETTAYVAEKDTKPNRITELHLSNLWEEAAYKMRKLDPSFAKILSEKSKYWDAIRKISRKEILENKMALWQVKEEMRRIIDSK